MRNKLLLLVGLLVFGSRTTVATDFPLPPQGAWLGSAGFGLILKPTLILLSPELEYVYRPNLYIGGLLQLGAGSPSLLTASGKVRYVIDYDLFPKIRPIIEGAFGLANGPPTNNSAWAVHIMVGFGVEYAYTRKMTLGSVVRFNFAPPINSSFVSWPMLIARFLL